MALKTGTGLESLILNNKYRILNSTFCGCVKCIVEFNATLVREFLDETGVCPLCRMPTVVPDASILFTKEDLRVWHNARYVDGNPRIRVSMMESS